MDDSPNSLIAFENVSSGLSASEQSLTSGVESTPLATQESVQGTVGSDESEGTDSFRCSICGATLKTAAGLSRHKLRHTRSDKLRKYVDALPNAEELLLEVPDIVEEVLNEMSLAPARSDLAKKINVLASELAQDSSEGWKEFYRDFSWVLWEMIVTSKRNYPLADREKFLVSRAAWLGDNEMQQKWRVSLTIIHPMDSNVIRMFLYDFAIKLSNCMAVFAIRKILSAENPAATSSTVDSRQRSDKDTLLYVSGFILKCFIKRARKYQNNKEWRSIHKCITSNFIENSETRTVPNSEEIRRWTVGLSRGGLIVPGLFAFDFFVEIDSLLENLEESENVGASCVFAHDKVINEVYQRQDILLKWDRVAGHEYLTEMGSLHLMEMIVKSFVNISGFAVAKLKKSELLHSNPHDAAVRKRLIQ